MNKVKLGIAGLGRIGSRHSYNIRYKIPAAELYAACSLDPNEIERTQKELGVKHVTQRFEELIAIDGLDAVIIATSSGTHCDLICQAVEAGVKNIFVEKPIVMTLEEADKVRRVVGGSGTRLIQVGYQRRYNQNLRLLKQKVESGAIGKPVLIKMLHRDFTWETDFLEGYSQSSGGLVFDMLTHDFDAARWLLGTEFKNIYGTGGVYRYDCIKGVDIDNVMLIAEFENGMMGTIEASRHSELGFDMENEIYGTHGSVRVNSAPYSDRLVVMDKSGAHQTGFSWWYSFWEQDYLTELTDFVDCVINARQPICSMEDGLKAVETAFKANEAIRIKKPVEF